MKLGGWHRLFVVLSAVWIIGFGLLLFNEPLPASVPLDGELRSRLQPSTAEILPYDQHAEGEADVRMPDGRRLSFSTADPERLLAAVKDYESVHAAMLVERNRAMLRNRVLLVFLPPMLLYAAGSCVAWIYRGFKG